MKHVIHIPGQKSLAAAIACCTQLDEAQTKLQEQAARAELLKQDDTELAKYTKAMSKIAEEAGNVQDAAQAQRRRVLNFLQVKKENAE